MPVLDTSFLIRLRSGDEAAAEMLREIEKEPLFVPPWVVVEFLTGFPATAESTLEELAASFVLVQTTPAWALAAAELRADLRRRRLKIRLPDFWIATFAKIFDTFVVTQNTKDFAVLGVETRSWASAR